MYTTRMTILVFLVIGTLSAATSGDRLGLYYNTRSMGGRPEFSRVTWGFYAWNSLFQEEGVWTYHVFFGDPNDDTERRPKRSSARRFCWPNCAPT